MNKPIKKKIILTIIGVVIVGLIIYGYMPGAVLVDTVAVHKGPMQVTIEEEGETYVAHHYVVTSPIPAFLRRVSLEPGDMVKRGDILAELEPPRSAILDPRSHAEATARVESAEAMLEQAEKQAEYALSERDRVERLAAAGSATQQQLEQVRSDAARAVAALKTAGAELSAAKASLVAVAGSRSGLPVGQVLRAPAGGMVLAVHRQSEGFVNTGEPLFEIGNTDSLEVHVDVLSQDAVRISPGSRVMLDHWGGEISLEAIVTRVERQGKIKISALGVEERRVRIVAELKSKPETWKNLGSGFRVLARIVIWEDEDVLQVPTSALFRTQDGWGVFTVEKGRAVRKDVSLGYQTGLSAQIIEGLAVGDVVIIHPDSDIEDGRKIKKNL
jgi:HlyD family secretion protein